MNGYAESRSILQPAAISLHGPEIGKNAEIIEPQRSPRSQRWFAVAANCVFVLQEVKKNEKRFERCSNLGVFFCHRWIGWIQISVTLSLILGPYTVTL